MNWFDVTILGKVRAMCPKQSDAQASEKPAGEAIPQHLLNAL
ncbi:hypothetical protein M7I_4694 [Glarea lozoyensis 74030]|uniref:Uncharacterized protein n=1 Tax=Glarea lozoyensis (strain ATCC 74030 / MF5533) TaxID=1104152 RepID=H0EPV6_GLAL7|nr:hypothetical protein M7I_4694 [Glarea lozoyensis 74030]